LRKGRPVLVTKGTPSDRDQALKKIGYNLIKKGKKNHRNIPIKTQKNRKKRRPWLDLPLHLKKVGGPEKKRGRSVAIWGGGAKKYPFPYPPRKRTGLLKTPRLAQAGGGWGSMSRWGAVLSQPADLFRVGESAAETKKNHHCSPERNLISGSKGFGG